MGAMMKIDYEMRTSCYLPMKADKSAVSAIMQFQNYMWIIEEAIAAYRLVS